VKKEEFKMGDTYDFSGWVTRYNTRCTDGRTLKDGAFAHCDGKKVPMAWQHDHDNPSNILGNVLLEHISGEGVYGYGTFNDTESGKDAKILVKHGDIDSLSIFANHLREQGNDVYHGDIKEVSLVLASANPKAYIDNVLIHGDDSNDPHVDITKAEIWTCPAEFEFDVQAPHIKHADESEEQEDMEFDAAKIYESMSDEQRALVDLLVDVDDEDEDFFEHADDDSEEEVDIDIDGILSTFTPEEKEALDYAISAIKSGGSGVDKAKVQKSIDVIEGMDDEKQFAAFYKIGASKKTTGEAAHREDDDAHLAHSDDYEGGNTTMRENIFDKQASAARKTTLSHADTEDIIATAKRERVPSLKELVKDRLAAKRATLSHADDDEHVPATYGIDYIDYLFPDAQAISEKPEFIKRDTGWVGTWMNGTKHVPFSRIKTIFADITEDAARAKGYIKGTQKVPEVFKLLKRVTEPCRVYKMQKLDKDDIDDIRWDIVPYMKAEMRGQVDEELARAGIYSDGRVDGVDNDKIDETKIRPVVKDADLYTIKIDIEGTNPTEIAMQIPDEMVLAMDEYKGSGNVVAFVKQSLYTRMLITKDGMGYRLYKSPAELASAMSVSKIVPVPNDIAGDNYVVGLDLTDYAYGSEKGGQMSTFDDFDIDFNQYKYLMEVRLSGALIKPYSAIVLRKKAVTGGQG
jgi:HK97 family phage prohead protease